jgi:phosphomevalonate kinase
MRPWSSYGEGVEVTAPRAMRAPGKLVLSGAYAVLEGAPAIVSAVDRRAIADASKAADFVTEEMRAAGDGPYPHVDASQLRQDGRKLGLGSSAAIVVAALATDPAFDTTTQEGRDALFAKALAAHRTAQAGGSGVDVAASVYGGYLRYQLPEPLRLSVQRRGKADELDNQWPAPLVSRLELPSDVEISVLVSPSAASTSDFLSRVYDWRGRDLVSFDRIIEGLSLAAESACQACLDGDARAFVSALLLQANGLRELGSVASVPIYTPGVARIDDAARRLGACVLPAGAGGGDVSLFVRERGCDTEALLQLARAADLPPLDVALGAPGVEPIS